MLPTMQVWTQTQKGEVLTQARAPSRLVGSTTWSDCRACWRQSHSPTTPQLPPLGCSNGDSVGMVCTWGPRAAWQALYP